VPGHRHELARELVEGGQRSFQRACLADLELEVRVRHRERALRRDPRGEQRVRDVVVADPLADRLVVDQLHGLRRVRDVETVLTHEHRKQHVAALGQPRREHHQLVGLLRVLGEQLDAPRVADEHRVRVIAVDVDRPRKSAVADGHHQRRAHRRSDVDHLGHEGEPLRRGGGHRARTREGGAYGCAHRGVLRLDVDDFRVRAAVRGKLGKGFDHRRLRGDRINGNDVGIDLAHRVGNGLGSCQ
jgi:hypothetical protein